jgi:hypothetical protein
VQWIKVGDNAVIIERIMDAVRRRQTERASGASTPVV